MTAPSARTAMAGILFACLSSGCGHRRAFAAPISSAPRCASTWMTVDIGTKMARGMRGVVILESVSGFREPMKGVQIYLTGADGLHETITDASGAFALQLGEGLYRLETCFESLETLVGTIVVDRKADEDSLSLTTRLAH